MSLEARRTPVPAADFHDSDEYDDIDSGVYYYADDYADRDGQRIRYELDATTRWSRSIFLMFYLKVVLTSVYVGLVSFKF